MEHPWNTPLPNARKLGTFLPSANFTNRLLNRQFLATLFFHGKGAIGRAEAGPSTQAHRTFRDVH
jgi:hypothetical protein